MILSINEKALSSKQRFMEKQSATVDPSINSLITFSRSAISFRSIWGLFSPPKTIYTTYNCKPKIGIIYVESSYSLAVFCVLQICQAQRTKNNFISFVQDKNKTASH